MSDKKLALSYPNLEPLHRRFIRYQGILFRTWGTRRYAQVSAWFSKEFPAGPETSALLSQTANLILGTPC